MRSGPRPLPMPDRQARSASQRALGRSCDGHSCKHARLRICCRILNNDECFVLFRRTVMWDLTDLHIFRVVVAEGGITMAARKLHRVPSSITMRIKHLEASVGTQLFFRSKQRLHVSPSGEVLLAFAAQLLRLSEEA